ncbi:MAG TPA: CvpA family protein [Candidatus Limnocylindrales bacterium]
MDLAGVIRSSTLFDLIFFLGLFAAFVLGYIQGVIRRLLGIASMVFAFLVAANLRDPLGAFLAANWTQFPREYSYLIGFGTLFVAFTVTFSIAIQGFYKRTPISARAPVIDEILGGLLGILQGLLLVAIGIMILDSFPFRTTAPFSGELGIVRSLADAVDGSAVHGLFHDVLIPGFLLLFGGLIPADVVRFYRS